MASQQRTEDIERLFDYAVDHPEKFKKSVVCRDLGWNRRYLDRVARDLRLMFNDDTATLIAEPDGIGEWEYSLVGNYEDSREWAVWMIKHLYSRLETEEAVAQTVVNATDGRSVEGRKARVVKKVLSRLREDLEELTSEDRLF